MDPKDYFNVKTCHRCGKLFQTFLEQNHCPTCYNYLEEKLEEVRLYTKANPKASLDEVVEALKVEKKQLTHWMQESRLKMSPESGASIPCQHCQSPILYGKFCSLCRVNLVDALESVYEDPTQKITGVAAKKKANLKMHYFSHKKR